MKAKKKYWGFQKPAIFEGSWIKDWGGSKGKPAGVYDQVKDKTGLKQTLNQQERQDAILALANRPRRDRKDKQGKTVQVPK